MFSHEDLLSPWLNYNSTKTLETHLNFMGQLMLHAYGWPKFCILPKLKNNIYPENSQTHFLMEVTEVFISQSDDD
jgi:hypothetical protein